MVIRIFEGQFLKAQAKSLKRWDSNLCLLRCLKFLKWFRTLLIWMAGSSLTKCQLTRFSNLPQWVLGMPQHSTRWWCLELWDLRAWTWWTIWAWAWCSSNLSQASLTFQFASFSLSNSRLLMACLLPTIRSWTLTLSRNPLQYLRKFSTHTSSIRSKRTRNVSASSWNCTIKRKSSFRTWLHKWFLPLTSSQCLEEARCQGFEVIYLCDLLELRGNLYIHSLALVWMKEGYVFISSLVKVSQKIHSNYNVWIWQINKQPPNLWEIYIRIGRHATTCTDYIIN